MNFVNCLEENANFIKNPPKKKDKFCRSITKDENFDKGSREKKHEFR